MTSSTRGFTLIEVIIAVLIVVLVTGVFVASFRSFSARRALDGASAHVISALEVARTQTLDSLSDSQYGVHIEATRVTIFKGATYTQGHVDNRIINLSPQVRVTSSLTGGVTDVTFMRLTGKASVTGTVTITLVADTSQTRVITIAPGGISS